MNFRHITTQYNNIICSYSFNTELRPSARNIFLHLSGTKTGFAYSHSRGSIDSPSGQREKKS